MGTAGAQLNIRVDAAAKQQAEAVCALMNMTLGGLVREVVTKVARGAQDLEGIRAVLVQGPRDADAPRAEGATSLLGRVDGRYEAIAREAGISLASFPVVTDDEAEALMYAYCQERDAERGIDV